MDLLVICCCCACKGGKPVIACGGGTLCKDSDCDALCDAEEGGDGRDTDRDGTPDYLDVDSDDDGVPDAEEAGDEDLSTPAFDRNLDGQPDYRDIQYPLGAGRQPRASPDASAPDSGEVAVPCQPVADGCSAAEPSGCNGLDEDCDGEIDEGQLCACQRGEVRRCFVGPQGRRGVGACEDGQQTCTGENRPAWGPCERTRGPTPELCDGLDNDCNGCADDRDGCGSSRLSCPSANDPRTKAALPYVPYLLDAAEFYGGGDAIAYNWYIAGSACDRLYASVDPSAHAGSGKLSFTLTRADQARAEALFSLSGRYDVRLRVLTQEDELYCDFTVHVRAPGMRVELCWDKTGPAAIARGEAVDLDLHFAKSDAEAFFTEDDCYSDTCRGESTPWGYPNTGALARCTGPSAQNYGIYSQHGFCPNPRLETDNRLDARSSAAYVTETISLDEPADDDRFRIMVHYRANISGASDGASDGEDAGGLRALDVHPIVGVYCDGELRGSFGGNPARAGDLEEVGLSYPGQMWRVADIVSRDSTCTLNPLVPPALGFGYWVSELDASYGE